MNNYPLEYINESRSRIDAQLSSYKDLITIARMQCGANEAMFESAVESFEYYFFNNMVLVLDNYFSNRSRMLELNDGNPLNEVRILSNSILNNRNIFSEDKTIEYQADNSVLKYHSGDEIKLTDTDFLRLYRAFFKELECRFSGAINTASL